jgi:Ca-activated chloride channel family protein
MHFESPWAFLLLLVIPALLIFRSIRGKRGAIGFSSTRNAAKSGRSWRHRLYQTPTALRILALIALTVALARPQSGREEILDISKGVAIEMVIDRSGSMAAEMEYQGKHMTRLAVVKEVFEEFVLGNGKKLAGRPNDLIGMITFARYPDTVCPLTLAHGALKPFLDTIHLVQIEAEDGTAIGDALALAAARLKKADETLAAQRNKNKHAYQIKSKVIILLSDGENNAGKRDPLQAADLAAEWGIKVYTIAITGGIAVQSIQTPFGMYKLPVDNRVDTTVLQKIAEKTGGQFWKADDADSLAVIYKHIDESEKSEFESIKYIDYTESFLPFALVALALIGGEVILNGTVFRKIP